MTEFRKPEKILIGSANNGKTREYRDLLSGFGVSILGLSDLDRSLVEPDETGSTFSENSAIKASSYAIQSSEWTLADDSGLEIAALGGRPGIFSARYGGDVSYERKMELILAELDAAAADGDRSARFLCAISLAAPDGTVVIQTNGLVRGTISNTPRGTHGFGYDPIFEPEGFDTTFGEMAHGEKSEVSHRARALNKFLHEMQILWAFDLTNRV